MEMFSFFSLRKSKRTWRQIHRYYTRKAPSLDDYTKETIQTYLKNLQGALLDKNHVEAKRLAKELEQTSHKMMPKTSFDKARDFIGGIVFALFIAVLIRTMWFELYTIPTGSMRPTLKEEDYLVVSKTDYGINVPLQLSHFYFDPSLVQRGSIIVFNGGNMDIEDVDTTYFYLFPGKKQFVKRLIGKPGDTLYFYGGQVYGLDAQGNELDLSEVNRLEHIPFIRFEGKAETPNPAKNGLFSPVVFYQMNQPVAKLSLTSIGTIAGEMLGQRGSQYSDLWGMKHYAMARLLTHAQVEKIHPNSLKDLEEGVLYLELTHHPSLQGAKAVRDEYNRMRPDLAFSTSIIPLQQSHLNEISKHMTTCRFIVKNGLAWRLGYNPKSIGHYLVKLPGVPDGTYEIQDGKVSKLPFPTIPIVGLFTNGITKEVPADHPLYNQDPETIQKLYNLGIEFLTYFAPSPNSHVTPSRYAYFRDQNLYLLGAPIIHKEDPALINFNKREQLRKSLSTTINPYFPFADAGTPNRDEILKNGIKIPEKMYMGLGDNHAMSADSRQFGFIPEDNLKGGVSFIFSPPGERWGRAPQTEQPHWTIPNVTVWTAFIFIAIATSLYYRRKLKKPMQF